MRTWWTVGPLLSCLLLLSLLRLKLRCLLLRGLLLRCLRLCRLLSANLIGLLLSRLLLSSLLFASLVGLLLCRLLLCRLLSAYLIGLLLSRLLPASLFCLLLCRLLLSSLLFTSLVGLLLCCLLLSSLLFTSLVGLLLCRLLLSSLLFASLVGLLLLCRRGPVGVNWLNLIGWGIRHRHVGGFIHGHSWRLRVGWRPGVTDDRLANWTVCTQGRGFTRWRLLDHGPCRRKVCRTQDLYFVSRQGLAGVLCQLLLLLGKWHRGRRRSCLCHHRTIGNGRRWPSDTIGIRCRSSENAVSGWSHNGSRHNGRRGDLFFADRHGRPRHRRRAPERALRDGGHCARHRFVHVRDVRWLLLFVT